MSLETLTRALLQQAFSSILEEELFASLPNLLTPTLYINQREFLRKARDDERQALLASYVRLLAHYGARITGQHCGISCTTHIWVRFSLHSLYGIRECVYAKPWSIFRHICRSNFRYSLFRVN